MAGGFKSTLSLGFQLSMSMLADESSLSDADVEDSYLREALRLGANEVDLMRIQWNLEIKRKARESFRPATGARLLDSDDVYSVDPELVRDAHKCLRERCMQDHRAAMEAEYARLGKLQTDFCFKDENKEDIDPIWTYTIIRAAMYSAGYDDPVETVFLKIRKGIKILNNPIGGGLHSLYIEKLAGLEDQLNRYRPGLAAEIGQQLKSVWGFVPRHIAGSTSLSNHAFGLAIDIDPAWNPMIKDKNVIAAIREITGYDFGVPLAAYCGLANDRIQQIHKQQQEASDRLRTWLHRFLPAYEAQSKKKPGKKADPLETDWSLDQSEVLGPNEKRLLDILSAGSDGPNQVRAWASHGIQTIPLEFAAAMSELGFGWGSEYENKKDVMHFELFYYKVLPRDVKHPRTLAALTASITDPAAKTPPSKKKPASVKAHRS